MEDNTVMTTEYRGFIRYAGPIFYVALISVILWYVFFYDVNGWLQSESGYEYYRRGSKVIGVQSLFVDEQPNTYIFDQSGTVKSGWIIYNGHYYYQDMENGIYTGDHIINGLHYYFAEDGVFHGGLYMQEGVAYINDKYGFSSAGLVSAGDAVYCSDENGRVLYGWQNIGSKLCYFDKVTGKMLTDGVYIIAGNGYGFDKNGGLIYGWHSYEDGDRYFNLTTGQMCIGDMIINKSKYYFEEDGVAFSGYRTVGDKVYYYSEKDNSLYKGWLQDGDSYMYFDNCGVRAEGLCAVEDKKYYFDEDGKMCTGWIGEHYFTNEGYMAVGFLEQNDKTFYFDEDGIRWTEAGWKVIDGRRYLFDDNGLITQTADIVAAAAVKRTKTPVNAAAANISGKVTPENLDSYLLGIMAQYGSDPQSIFNYCRQFSYKYRDKADINTMACRILNNKNGACWDYAALCYKMLRLAGYNCQIVIGKGAIYSEHNWILIEIAPGVWRHMDPERKGYYIYMLTDAQLESYDGIARSVRYQWNHSAYPAAQ